jgi:hypothetical protein
LANPPFLSPDEPSHYVRAVSVSAGQLAPEYHVTVPPGLWAIWRHERGITCNAGRSKVSAACVADAETANIPSRVWTAAGAYPPFYYVLPGLALRAADDPFTANRLGRLAATSLCFLLLVLSVALLMSSLAPRLALLGLLVAVTPMALFLMGSLNPSGLEIAAGIAFFSALLRVARDERPPPWVLGSAAAAGIVLALSRTTGAAWIVLDLALFVGLVGRSGALRLVRGSRYGAGTAVVAGVLLVAVLANRVWEHANGSVITRQAGLGEASVDTFLAWLRPAVVQLPRVFNEYVGVFGWVDALMPGVAYAAWHAILALIVGLAFVVGSRRERTVLVLALLASLATVVVISAILQSMTAQDVQGRHVLPFAVVVPLLAGEMIFRNRSKLALVDTGMLFALCAVGVGALQLVAWHANGQRQGVGSEGPLLFLSDPSWSPPLGWYPWLIAVLAGAALLALAAADRIPSLRRR